MPGVSTAPFTSLFLQRMITFIHTADWQLGKPFSRVADEEKRTALRSERIAAVRRIGEIARAANAAFVVVAGDLFDSTQPTKSTISAACDAIASLGVPVYVIPGNHDHAGPGSVWEQPFFVSERRDRAPNLHILLEAKPVESDGSILLPCPLHRRQSLEDPTLWIRDLDTATFDDRPRIVIAHGSTVSFTQESDEEDGGRQPNLIELTKLPLAAIDYVALGDWHGFVQAGDKAWYSGSHETDRFPKTGQTPGHVAVVRASRGAPPAVEAHATGRTRWLTHAETFATDAGPESLKETLNHLVGNADRGLTLLKLSLSGSLGLAGHATLEQIVQSWAAGLLDLQLDRDVAVAPTREEIEALTQRAGDPLISSVARELREQIDRGGEDAALAGTAIALLHEFVHAGGTR